MRRQGVWGTVYSRDGVEIAWIGRMRLSEFTERGCLKLTLAVTAGHNGQLESSRFGGESFRCENLEPVLTFTKRLETAVRSILLGVGVFVGLCGDVLSADRIVVEPERIEIISQLDQVQLLVTLKKESGEERDVTRVSSFILEGKAVASIDSRGRVEAAAAGEATLVVRHGEFVARLPVVVGQGFDQGSSRFVDHVLPVLSRSGCNQGACHASQFGKGGFKLSVFAFAPEADHLALTREWDNRRVSLVSPEDSLVLRKATLQVGHGGGRRFLPDTYAYNVLKMWVSDGAPGPVEPGQSESTRIVGLGVFPHERTYRSGQTQQLRVVARYADGHLNDVTRRAAFDSLESGIASVDSDGQLAVTGSGQAAIMVRFRGQTAVSHVISPFLATPAVARDTTGHNLIDKHVARRWERLNMRPAPRCSDAEFIRRAFLDCLGTLPRPEVVERFLASDAADKRDRLVDQILGLTGDPALDLYVDEWSTFWTLKFSDVLRNNRKTSGDAGMWAFHNWIRQSLRHNKPYDQFTRELITAQGSIFEHGPANFIASSRRPTDVATISDPADLAETTAQVFLGIRLQCARCHHHPFESYSQSDFYGLAAFFTRLDSKSSGTFGELGFDAVVSLAPLGAGRAMKHPRSGQVVAPRPLGGAVVDTRGVLDIREPLVDWLVSPKNRLYSRNIVNRIWGHFLGTGIVEPVDDLRSTNPPTNPQLLDAVADDFVAHKYDLKHLMRRIMTSATYQLSSTAHPEHVNDRRFYTHYNVKRLSAEVLLDAIDHACGTHERFPGVPPGTRAIALPDPNFESYFLDTLGRPRRLTNCECERTAEPNMSQVLHLCNGEKFEKKLADKNGRLSRLVSGKRATDEIVSQLYLATFSRLPSDAEMTTCREVIGQSENRRKGLENILWALCNSREFLFNH